MACVIWLPTLRNVCGITLILCIEINYAGNRDTIHRTDTMREGEREGKPLYQIPCRQEGCTREEWPAALTTLLGQPEQWQANLSVFNLDSWNNVNVRTSLSYLQRERVFLHRVHHVSAFILANVGEGEMRGTHLTLYNFKSKKLGFFHFLYFNIVVLKWCNCLYVLFRFDPFFSIRPCGYLSRPSTFLQN